VYDALPQEAKSLWVFPVGRLDKDSEGLLLFTNDGPWAEQFTGGTSHAVKRYRVKLDKPPAPEALVQFRSGIMLDEQVTLPCEVEHEHGVWVLVGLREGRNRQIRRMFHALGYAVKRLIRVGIGQLNLTDEFASGAFRWLTEEEKQMLLGSAG